MHKLLRYVAISAACLVGSALLAAPAVQPAPAAASPVLYDPAHQNFPDDQGWFYAATTTPIGGVPGVTRHFDTAAGLAVLDTTDTRSDRAGYSNYNPITLQRLPGFPDLVGDFAFRFVLDVRAEAHNPRDDNNNGLQDRAGINLILTRQDGLGVSISWQEDRVWAYTWDPSVPGLVQGEGVPFDAVNAGAVDYRLELLGNDYTLLADGSPLLSGPLRDLSIAGIPYALPSYLFFGDNTTSADGIFGLGIVAIPEPGALALLATPALLLRRRRL